MKGIIEDIEEYLLQHYSLDKNSVKLIIENSSIKEKINKYSNTILHCSIGQLAEIVIES